MMIFLHEATNVACERFAIDSIWYFAIRLRVLFFLVQPVNTYFYFYLEETDDARKYKIVSSPGVICVEAMSDSDDDQTNKGS